MNVWLTSVLPFRATATQTPPVHLIIVTICAVWRVFVTTTAPEPPTATTAYVGCQAARRIFTVMSVTLVWVELAYQFPACAARTILAMQVTAWTRVRNAKSTRIVPAMTTVTTRSVARVLVF